MTVKFAAIQLNSGDNVADNLAACAEHIQSAKLAGCDSVLLPECFAWMGQESAAKTIAETLGNGEVQTFLSQQARQHRLWLIGGGHKIIAKNDSLNRLHNTALVYNPYGKLVGHYHKVHLFDAAISESEQYSESSVTAPGEQLKLISTPLGKIGLSICYDLRFPYFFNQLRQAGADIIVVPSAFTVKTGKAHWEVLLRARAIENQVYIIAAAQVGMHPNGRETYGHTLCVDPWGNVNEIDHQQSGALVQLVDLNALNKLRKEMPIWAHRRENLTLSNH